jgi:hypothetical protein
MPAATLETVEASPTPRPSISPETERRRAEITAEIAALLQRGLPLPGSLVARRTRCGNPNCRCRAEPPRLHGPYPSWTRKTDGKTVTRTLTADQAERYHSWFDTARRLRALLADLEHLALDHAQATDDWPRT